MAIVDFRLIRTVVVLRPLKRGLSAARADVQTVGKQRYFRTLCLYLMLVVLGGPAFGLSPNRQISQYAHTAWRTQDGSFSGWPNVVTQTTDGYLWIGTQAGLLRFDGVRFVPWAPPDGNRLPSTNITALLGAGDGSLWVGTGTGLYHWVDHDLIRYPNIHGKIQSIVEGRKGAVWITQYVLDGSEPFCQIVGTGTRCYGDADGLPPNVDCCWPLVDDTLGNLWIGASTMLLRWKSGSPVRYLLSGLKANGGMGGVGAIAPAPDGSLWVGTNVYGPGLGLLRLVQGVWKPFHTPELDGATLNVVALLLDHENSLWVGTVKQGIYRIRGSTVDHFDARDGLSGDNVYGFYEDRERNLWVATSKGLDSFRETRITSFSTREGLSTDQVDSVLASRDGTVWVGSDGALDALYQGKVSSIQTGKGLPGEQITSLLEDHAGRLWVGIDNQLTIYNGGTFTRINRPNGKPIGVVVGLTEDLEKNIWVEVIGPPRTLIRIRDRHVREMFLAPQIPAAREVTADPQGGIWLGLISGDLARYRHGKLETFPFQHHPSSPVDQLIVSPSGSVLGATAFGVVGWLNGTKQILTIRNGLPCDGINGLIFDSQGNLWLYTQCGLVELSTSELQKWWEHPDITVQVKTFEASDGFQSGSADFNPTARSPDGRLWFANSTTLQMIDPAHFAGNALPPPVQVEEVVADRKHYSAKGALRLPPLTRDLELDYTALSFVTPQRVRFLYKLTGWDKNWQDAGTRREAFYTNLGPGNYRFQVLACNNDGVWNRMGAGVEVTIAPAFYQTRWFIVFLLAASAAMMWLLYVLRLKQVTAQIEGRRCERLEERERIARDLHDTLLQGFQGLMLRFQTVMEEIPDHEPAHQLMDKVLDRADEVLLEGRERISNLRAEAIPGNDLPQALASCGQELAQDSCITFTVAVLGSPRPLDSITFDEVYRIGREALINAFQHSNGSKIEVEITYDFSTVRLRVRDDGRGIDQAIVTDGKRGHWGLSGVRERANKIDGDLNIWSTPGVGTEIDLIIPAKVAYRGARWFRRCRTNSI